MKLNPRVTITSIQKFTSTWIKDLNEGTETINNPQKKTRANLCGLVLGTDMTAKVQVTTTTRNCKLNFIQVK